MIPVLVLCIEKWLPVGGCGSELLVLEGEWSAILPQCSDAEGWWCGVLLSIPVLLRCQCLNFAVLLMPFCMRERLRAIRVTWACWSACCIQRVWAVILEGGQRKCVVVKKSDWPVEASDVSCRDWKSDWEAGGSENRLRGSEEGSSAEYSEGEEGVCSVIYSVMTYEEMERGIWWKYYVKRRTSTFIDVMWRKFYCYEYLPFLYSDKYDIINHEMRRLYTNYTIIMKLIILWLKMPVWLVMMFCVGMKYTTHSCSDLVLPWKRLFCSGYGRWSDACLPAMTILSILLIWYSTYWYGEYDDDADVLIYVTLPFITFIIGSYRADDADCYSMMTLFLWW